MFIVINFRDELAGEFVFSAFTFTFCHFLVFPPTFNCNFDSRNVFTEIAMCVQAEESSIDKSKLAPACYCLKFYESPILSEP